MMPDNHSQPGFQLPLCQRGLIVVLSPVLLVLLPLIALVAIPYIYSKKSKRRKAEVGFTQAMVEAGRYLPWEEVKLRLDSPNGSLIFEYFPLRGTPRLWWCDADILAEAPCKIHASEEKDADDAQENWEIREDYAAALFHRHLDPEHGTALLSECPADQGEIGLYVEADRVVTIETWILKNRACDPDIIRGVSQDILNLSE